MMGAAVGTGPVAIVDLAHLTSPLRMALAAAAIALVLALWWVRNPRARNLAVGRGRHPAAHSLGTGVVTARERRPLAALGDLARHHRRRDLAAALEPYRLTPLAPQRTPEEDAYWSLLTVPFLKRFSVAQEGIAARTRVGRSLATSLERAGARARLGELLTIWLIASIILLGLGWALAGPVGSLILLILVFVVPPAALQAAVDHRTRLFAAQLPDVLKLTASSLRAGFSLLQGLEAVTRQLHEPSAGELQRVLTEARLGRPVEEALESAADRIRNRDFSESVAAVRIQQEAGGNLASLFDTLAETMVQRLRLRREVRALTAEGRLSAYILGAMPLVLGIFIFVVDRSYILELFHSAVGQVMLVGGLVLQIVGFFWMYRVVKIEA
ncbi:MAG: type II secretion system F family protein [Acidimicrobiales bacterium]|jgi:tight adherence protein B